MQTIELSSLSDQVRALQASGPLRDRQLHRLIDLHASQRAADALADAASHAVEEPARKMLAYAAEVLGSNLSDSGPQGVESAAFDRLREVATSPEGLSLLRGWVRELRQAASARPETGGCTIGTALELWSWTTKHFLDDDGAESLPALDELTEALCPLLAARCFALHASVYASEGAPEEGELMADLSRVNAARSAARAGATCAELVFGYRRHLVWDAEGCATCYTADELDGLEAYLPGFASGASVSPDIIEADGSHPAKAGPCAKFDGLESFMRLRHRLDGCLTGARMARHRAASAILAAQAPGGIA